jgi:hypothetical protein
MAGNGEELKTCPQCGKGKMRPLPFTSLNRDKDTDEVKDEIRARECDECGYREKTAVVND